MLTTKFIYHVNKVEIMNKMLIQNEPNTTGFPYHVN